MEALGRLPASRLLALGAGSLVGIALLVGAYWFVVGFGPGPGACACSPPTEFSFAEKTTGEGVTVSITHEGGRELAAGDLLVTVDGRVATWAARADVASGTAVGPGDRLTVTADPGDRIRIEWRSADGDSRTTVSEHRVG
ncbi:MAG: hypothetical protein ABEJ30_04300 [Halorientalis sp.]